MSDALENKAVEILDKSQTAVTAFADKMGDLAKQYGPDIADAALKMARIDAINKLFPYVLGAVILVIVSELFLKKMWPLIKDDVLDGGPSGAVLFLFLLFIGIAAVPIFIGLSDIWAWVGIFEPKIWLAKRILGL